MPVKLLLPDERMLKLMAWAIEKDIAANESEYLEKIEFSRTNISNIRKGLQKFTREHILNACRLTGANANWILGLEHNVNRKEKKSPIEALKEAVIAVEEQLQKPVEPSIKKKDLTEFLYLKEN